jgi:hypothetical protein
LEKNDMSYSLPYPAVVAQHGDANCWAAALESWMKAVGSQDPKTQDQLVREFSGTGFSVEDFKNKAILWRMDYRIVDGSRFPGASEIEHTIKLLGYLFIAFKWEDNSTPWWHCNVLFGVQTPKREKPFYLVMDPANGGKLGSRLQDSFFSGGNRLFIGWQHKDNVRRG